MDEKRSCKRKHSEKEKSKSAKHKKKKSKKYKKYSDSSDASTNSDSSSSVSSVEHQRQKHKFSKNNLKHKRRKSKHEHSSKTNIKKKKSKKKHKEKSLELTKDTVFGKSPQKTTEEPLISDIGPMPAEPSKTMAPMTKEEWDKQQSVIRRVYDPETGRNRLVKGDGEILEEIVSRERHKEINKMATFNDGEFFKAKVGL